MKPRMIVVIAAMSYTFALGCSQAPQQKLAQDVGPAASNAPRTSVQPPGRSSAPVPAYVTDPNVLRRLPPTLSSTRFVGRIAEAYAAAEKIPITLAQLPCYCHCDAALGHASLHTCYESEHSAHCGICQDEAILAAELKKQQMDDRQIRDLIVAHYSAIR